MSHPDLFSDDPSLDPDLVKEYQALIESFTQAFWEADAQGLIMTDSPSWRAYTGQSVEEWLGQGWINAVHPEDQAYALDQWYQALQKKVSYNVTYRLKRPGNQGWQWTNVRAKPLLDSEGSVTKWVGVNFALTEIIPALRKATQPSTEARQQFILESARDYAFITLDVERRVTSWSVGAKMILGYAEKEILGQSGDLFFTPEDRAQGHPAAEAAKAFNQGRAENERWHLRKDGSRFYGSGMTTPLLNTQGSIIGLTKVIQDLTAQKQAEEALQRSQAHLLAIFQTAQVGISEVSRAGKFLQVNDRLCQLLGRDSTELIGRHISDVTFPEDIPLSQQALLQLLSTGEVVSLDKRYLKADGSFVWANSSISLLRRKGYHTTTILAITIDLTHRKEAEQALTEAARRKDEFLAMLAHELRNPMATLRNGLQILSLTTASNAQAKTVVDRMTRQTDHLVRMVDDLLDVSRISQGKIELRKERVNLVELAHMAVESLRPLYQQKLYVNLPMEPVQLEGDPTRLVQVMINLLTNASRYTDPLGEIHLSLEHTDQLALLRVQDNGIGLAADQLTVIFELFVQIDTSLARSQGGLGLGLTLVRQIVERHGGKVEAASEGIGKGSTFSVYLPTLRVAQSLTMRPVETIVSDQKTCILLIDDNPDATLTLGMLLELKGYEIHATHSGREGIAVAEQLKPEVILLDIGMPDLNGYETCQYIRQQPWGQTIFIVAVSGYGQQEDQERARGAGFDGHVTKPVKLDFLVQLINDRHLEAK